MEEGDDEDLKWIPTEDLIARLPLRLNKSETIPAAPNPGGSAIDWLPDMAGYAWVAYGASSCLVISHFPSPSPYHQTSSIGPIFRQVFELAAPVPAVAWSPTVGDLAAASANSICLFSPHSSSPNGSFCWSQTGVLVQANKVEAITWTASGDGIIAGGVEVLLWKNKGSSSWEPVWKFKEEKPQTLVSATWSLEGPSATATHTSVVPQPLSQLSEADKSVMVFQRAGGSEYVRAELRHPHPVSFIQWRPSSSGPCVRRDAKHSATNLLLTCCLDGTVRLWGETHIGKVRKHARDVNEQNHTRLSFCVTAVIEVNQVLNGTLGEDVFVAWATDIQYVINPDMGDNPVFPTKGYQISMSGKCDWVIGFGPGMLLTFWAVHCIDDISPVRFPRVTLWKQRELQCPGLVSYQTGSSNSMKRSLLYKASIFKNQLFSPPTLCSLIRSLNCNSLECSLLYTQALRNIEDGPSHESRPEDSLPFCATEILNIDGHTGYIIQVTVHPCSPEVKLAASLDSDGMILFWSTSNNYSYNAGPVTLNHGWKFCGKLLTQDASIKYTSLKWGPQLFEEDPILLIGHAGGIDCIIVKVPQRKDETIVCHNLCTMPFSTKDPGREGPADIFSIPLPSVCKEPCNSIKFMMIGVWVKDFQALSWNAIFHSFDLLETSHKCCVDSLDASNCRLLRLENTFSSKRYSIILESCSFQFPHPHSDDEVTSFAVISTANLNPSAQQKLFVADDMSSDYSAYPAYHMATGCSNGSLKLWKSNHDESSIPHSYWELAGVFVAHEGPVNAISLTNCGRKIATICTGQSITSTLCIWDSLYITGSGSFLLEDSLSMKGDVLALNWLTLGNGQFLLGLCMTNELQIYSPKRLGGQTLLDSEKSERHIWLCLAVAYTSTPIRGFLWGPMATTVVVHDDYFSIFGQWLFETCEKCQVVCHPNCAKDNPHDCKDGTDIFPIFFDSGIDDFKTTSMLHSTSKSGPAVQVTMNEDQLSCNFSAVRHPAKYNLHNKVGLWSILQVGERLFGSLPVYHPQALIVNICSGNLKRAHIAVQHLLEHLSSNDVSGKSYDTRKRSYNVPQIHLSNYLEELIVKSSTEQFQWNADSALNTSSQFQRGSSPFSFNSESYASNHISSSMPTSEVSSSVELLEKFYKLAAITNIEKMQILGIIDLLNEVSNTHLASAYKSLDDPGRRFQQLYFCKLSGRESSIEDLVVDSELIGWAFHSDCQEILFGSVLPIEPSWQDMQTLGVGFWLTNATQLRTKMEKLARSQYLKSKDPKACMLLYVALNRLQVLSGLFKISKDEKDKPLVGFLSRNFQEEKSKAAAIKNAYVLMSRHQLELAIAFFLLGGDASSAVTVCAKNLGDEQLALVICRLVDGYSGSLEQHLISKLLLPSAIEKGDRWRVSLFEWILGNYVQSFLSMISSQMGTDRAPPAFVANDAAFLNPSIGLYCLTLATKNNMRNAVGEQNAAIMGRWGNLMTATSLYRCGLPLEALERYSSSPILGSTDQGSISNVANYEILRKMLMPDPRYSLNWLLGNAAYNLESHKLDLAMHYLSKLIMEHPSWPDTSTSSHGTSSDVPNIVQCEVALQDFQYKLQGVLACFEQKFCLVPACLVNMILVWLTNNGLLLMGYDILSRYSSQDYLQDTGNVTSSILYPALPKLLLEDVEEISCSLSQFIVVCSISLSQLQSSSCGRIRLNWPLSGCHLQSLVFQLQRLRSTLKMYSCYCTEDLVIKSFIPLDLFEYVVDFAFAWLQRNLRCLVLMAEPLITCSDGSTPYEMGMTSLDKLLHQIEELFVHNFRTDGGGRAGEVDKCSQDGASGSIISSVHEDERWHIIGASLWQHMSCFVKYQLKLVFDKLGEDFSYKTSLGTSFSNASSLEFSKSDGNIMNDLIKLVSSILAKKLEITLVHVSSHQVKQLASLLWRKVEDGLDVRTLEWLEDSCQSQSRMATDHVKQGSDNLEMINGNIDLSFLEKLWGICADPKIISASFARERISWSECIKQKPSKKWSETYEGMVQKFEIEENSNQEGRLGGSSASGGLGTSAKGLFGNGYKFLTSGQKDSNLKKHVMYFQNPKEIYRRNGELLEALCLNSVDQWQAAIAGNRKGIIFFNLEDSLPFRNRSDCIWSEADWPQNGWAGSVSTPVPTCVSPGIGLGNKKGAHLGLGGATIGVGSLAGPGRNLTGSEAFGTSGYAGSSASSLGWEIQEDFEEFIDPPATVDSISTRAFSSHPSRPFFLAGSSNTHIYMWEFGKDRATATYGVLPAANVPPPYALASISSVQFDHFGHRFATAASDGTVCTWQLEVGGRSNIYPTESSICFNQHASDVTYVTSSGSIIAVAGCSSNNVNVVIWDTLAPHTTSRASIVCHEGGARSLAVFDNDIGSGSISPLIVTGGKGGDVGLHDFRYIATGRTKRHRHPDSSDMAAGLANKHGDMNSNGMLWYIPKAHLGSVTKIITIPNTSLFLTGSKDGDVKLWDAKQTKLVFHWSKLHERHTFLQPNSRGVGGVVRAAVTGIQVVSNGFLTCGGDGSVKLVRFRDRLEGT